MSVAILLSVYKPQEEKLIRTIQSIKYQTYSNWKLIIILDGCPRKKVLNIVNKYLNSDMVKVIELKQNIGLTSALNVGSRAVNEEFIARIDDDDEWESNHLEDSISYLESNKKTHVIGSSFVLINNNTKQSIKIKTNNAWYRALFGGKCAPHSSLVFRTDSFNQVKGYSEHQKRAQDRSIILKLCNKFGLKAFTILISTNVKIYRSNKSLSSGPNQRFYSSIARLSILGKELSDSQILYLNKKYKVFEKAGLKNKFILAFFYLLTPLNDK